MPWLSKTEAARALGVSARAVARGVSDGMLESKQEGALTLIHVSDDGCAEPPGGACGHSDYRGRPDMQSDARRPRVGGRAVKARGGVPGARPARVTGDSGVAAGLADTVTAIDEARAAVVEAASMAQLAAREAVEARRRTVDYLKLACALSAVVVGGLLGIGAWQYERMPASPSDEVGNETQVAATDSIAPASSEALFKDALDAERNATAVALRDLEKRVVEAQQRALESNVLASATAAEELRAGLAELHEALSAVIARQDELACEWEQLIAAREQDRIERTKLAESLNAMRHDLVPADTEPTLRDVIDIYWNPRR